MLMKVVVPFLALFTQASGSIIGPLVERSSLELLVARQTGVCPSCTTFSDAVDSCTTRECLCTVTIADTLQACVICAVTNSPTSSVISAAQTLIETYKSTCGVTLTVPANIVTGTATGTVSAVIPTGTTRRPSSTTRAVVTEISSDPNIPKTVVGPSATDPIAPTPSGLGITRNSSTRNNVQKMSVLAIGAMIGFALAL